MAEYIEREAAQGAIMKRKWAIGSDGAMAMEAISTIPVADVAPVRHGHWVNLNGKLVCNLCGVFAKWASEGNGFWGMAATNFCPNCGAKMDEEVR